MPIFTARPDAATEAPLFTAESDFFISNIFICAHENAGNFSLGVIPSGESTTTWLFSAVGLKKSETFNITALALRKGDVIRVLGSVAGMHFTLTGDGT